MPFDYENYQRKRLLQHMKTCKAWMRKVGLEIRETARQYGFAEKEMQWLICAGQLEASANSGIQTWIDELERIINESKNSGTCTAHSGRCSNIITENDGVQQTGVQNSISDTQVQEEK